METKIRNKTFDIAIQALIPCITFLSHFIGTRVDFTESIGWTYFGLGGWQLISTLVHLGVNRTLWNSSRKLYIGLLIATIAIPIITVAIDEDSFITVGLIVLGWTAIMAVFYFIMSILELRKWKKIVAEELQNAFNEESK